MQNTAFRTWYRHYKFLVISFGLTNTPVVFMDLTQCVLQPFLDWFVMVLIDDILEYSPMIHDHELHLRAMLYESMSCILSLASVSFGL